MSTIERLTITMPADMAAIIKAAVDAGDYASTSEVVREALREWKMRRLSRFTSTWTKCLSQKERLSLPRLPG